MASTVALLTGLSGLNANARSIEVIGNNIANSSTTGFKSTRLVFSDSLKRTFSGGTAPSPESGGTNPNQVGLGVNVASTQRNFSQGAVAPTGDARDLAIEGDGFFIVERSGDRFYTRDGSFRLDEAGNLVTAAGQILQGFGVDDDFNVIEGALQGISVPIGARSVAEQTTQVRFAGNLNAAGDLPAGGSVLNLTATTGSGLSLIAGATVPAGPGNLLEATSLLTEIEDPLQVGSGVSLFAAGQILRVDGVQRNGATMPAQELVIDATTTVQDYLDMLSAAIGTLATGPNPDGLTPGASLDPTTGVMTLVGHTGEVNDLDIPGSAIRLLNGDGTLSRLPFATSELSEATGESKRTTFVVYDSLGSPLEVNLTFSLEQKTSTGTVWRYFVDSGDDLDGSAAVATGTVAFDTFGALLTEAPINIQLDRNNTGALTPMAFTINLGDENNQMTALADAESELAAVFRDGRESGTLDSFAVSRDGTVVGTFSNGLFRPLGRVAVATFTNPAGMEDLGSNLFRPSANSGDAVVVTPTTFGAGSVIGGALEQSNVDLGGEFINLIVSSTGYSASSRVIQTADDLLQELISIAR